MTIIAATAAALLTVSSAAAHARLKESSPAVGEVLQAPPAEVSITFTNDLQKISGTYGIEVTDQAGRSVVAAPAELDDGDRSIMTVALQPNLAAGRYVVQYKNISDEDGDRFEAGFAFYVGVVPTAEQRAADALLDPAEISVTQTFVAGGAGTSTPGASESPGSGTAAAPAASPTAGDSSSNDDSGSVTTTIIVVAVVVAGGLVGFFGIRWITGRRA